MEEETYKLKYSDEYLDHIEKHLKSGQVEPLKGYGEVLSAYGHYV